MALAILLNYEFSGIKQRISVRLNPTNFGFRNKSTHRQSKVFG
jgi:hypothetical protein